MTWESGIPASFSAFAGWHNLRNDLTGEIGLEFRVCSGRGEKWVTHLGLWDDHERDRPVRSARALPELHQSDLPPLADPQGTQRRLKAAHTLRLLRVDGQAPAEIARCRISPDHPGELIGAFRYVRLKEPLRLGDDAVYALLMSTEAGDGDRFHDPASFDGLSPIVHPDVLVERSILVRNGDSTRGSALPAFKDLSPSHARHRLPVGPTLLFKL